MSSPDKILWLGPYAVGEYFDTLLKENTYVQTAANRVQSFYINELYNQMGKPIDIVSALITIPYPKSHRKKLMGVETKVSEDINIYNVPYMNYPYISVISQEWQLKKKIKDWIRKNTDKSVWVIVYSMRLPLLKCAKLIKEQMKNVKVINIIPDLPQYMHETCSLTRRLALSYYCKKLSENQKCVDLFSFYTEGMRNFVPCEGKATVVIEGLFTNSYATKIENKTKHDKKTVVYAGVLNEQYGVGKLVEAFRYLSNHEFELHLYGQGDYLLKLDAMMQQCGNVKYMGLVTPEIAYNQICAADLVINPRPSSPEYTKYSFPSKTFEYMASGTPLLMTKLPGIPEEYYRYVHIIDTETPEGIADAIKKVFQQKTYILEDKAKRAQEYILKEKNSEKQVGKLIKAIQQL